MNTSYEGLSHGWINLTKLRRLALDALPNRTSGQCGEELRGKELRAEEDAREAQKAKAEAAALKIIILL